MRGSTDRERGVMSSQISVDDRREASPAYARASDTALTLNDVISDPSLH